MTTNKPKHKPGHPWRKFIDMKKVNADKQAARDRESNQLAAERRKLAKGWVV